MSKTYGPKPNCFTLDDGERYYKKIQDLGCAVSYINSNIMLVKANEVEEIFEGQEEKYRSGGGGPSIVRPDPASLMKNKGAAPWMSQQVTSGSHHLESVPCSTPAAHARGHLKNGNTPMRLMTWTPTKECSRTPKTS
uniref:Uncharacterized protein n=1 Tax=Ditylenchus dipsaci TaxID=166011 RepID=A0A915CYI8_9BILA